MENKNNDNDELTAFVLGICFGALILGIGIAIGVHI